MRTCYRCQERPARNKCGRPICNECAPRPIDRKPSTWVPVICPQCKERPVDGAKRCTVCRLTCVTCHQPWDTQQSAECVPCKKSKGTFRPIRQRVCRECDRPFKTRGGNYTCSACVNRAKRHPCATCADLIDPRSKVCTRCWGEQHRGSSSPNWRGGRTHMKVHGYVLVQSPGHPNADPRGYVREHVLVMSNVLGRPLLPNENVHHKNGVRDDNRPENLELWVKSQPSGQRVMDLLDWARTIVARYDPVEHLIREEEDVDAVSPVLPLFGRTDR